MSCALMTTPDTLAECQAYCELLKLEVQQLSGVLGTLTNGVCWCQAAFARVPEPGHALRHSDACELAGLLVHVRRRDRARQLARENADLAVAELPNVPGEEDA